MSDEQERFDEIVNDLGIEMKVVPDVDTSFGEHDTQTFRCMLSNHKGQHLVTRWACGSAVPLRDFLESPGKYPARFRGGMGATVNQDEARKIAAIQPFGNKRLTIFEDEIRCAIREHYRPELSSVFANLMTDETSLEEHSDWLTWGEDFGMLDDADSSSLAKIRISYYETLARSATFRKMIGDIETWNELVELSSQL